MEPLLTKAVQLGPLLLDNARPVMCTPDADVKFIGGSSSIERVGPFVLGKTLGQGTTGKVKEGRHHQTGFKVAVKVVKQKDLRDAHQAKVAREIAVLRLIDHPHILTLYDVLQTPKHLFLVMEHVQGGELFDYIADQGRLSRAEALRFTAQIAQGLAYCHQFGVCHRDLKPENILLDSARNVKVGDFGMAQVMKADQDWMNTACGSPHYVSPEVLSGQAYDGKKADVWSLGIILFAFVTARLPFDHENVPYLLQLVLAAKYKVPHYVDADIADLISQMLTPDPAKRIEMGDVKRHRCFSASVSRFFPPMLCDEEALCVQALLQGRPACSAFFKATPLQNELDVDSTVLADLVSLGWGTKEQLAATLLKHSADPPLELVFYYLLIARRKSRKSFLSQRAPSADVSPSRVERESLLFQFDEEEEQDVVAPLPFAEEKATGRVARAAAVIESEFETTFIGRTPKFKRPRFLEENTPKHITIITPSDKRSWFSNVATLNIPPPLQNVVKPKKSA